MSLYPLPSSSRELPRPVETPAFHSEEAETSREETLTPAQPAVAVSPVVTPSVTRTPSFGAIFAPVVTLLGLVLIVALGAYSTFNASSHSAKPVVKDIYLDNAHNVRYLAVNIDGKPYVCNPTMDSLASLQIHCDAAGTAQ